MNVQKTRDARSQAVVIYTKFCQSKALHKKALFCFYEGEDSKYYGNRVEQFTGRSREEIVSYNCGGKAQVLKVKEMIEKKEWYKNVKTAFFIDSDYFPHQGLDSNVFQTNGYSVENYYTSKNAFGRILNYAFGINCNSSDYSKCISDYTSSMDMFHACMLECNAWIKAQRLKELRNGKRKLDLVNFKVAKFFNVISIDNIVIKQAIDKTFLEEYFMDLSVDEKEIKRYMEEFRSTNMQQTFRGKFDLEFLKKIIMDLRQRNKDRNYFEEHYECVKLDANVDSLLVLSQFADTPDCLICFLRQFVIEQVA